MSTNLTVTPYPFYQYRPAGLSSDGTGKYEGTPIPELYCPEQLLRRYGRPSDTTYLQCYERAYAHVKDGDRIIAGLRRCYEGWSPAGTSPSSSSPPLSPGDSYPSCVVPPTTPSSLESQDSYFTTVTYIRDDDEGSYSVTSDKPITIFTSTTTTVSYECEDDFDSDVHYDDEAPFSSQFGDDGYYYEDDEYDYEDHYLVYEPPCHMPTCTCASVQTPTEEDYGMYNGYYDDRYFYDTAPVAEEAFDYNHITQLPSHPGGIDLELIMFRAVMSNTLRELGEEDTEEFYDEPEHEVYEEYYEEEAYEDYYEEELEEEEDDDELMELAPQVYCSARKFARMLQAVYNIIRFDCS